MKKVREQKPLQQSHSFGNNRTILCEISSYGRRTRYIVFVRVSSSSSASSCCRGSAASVGWLFRNRFNVNLLSASSVPALFLSVDARLYLFSFIFYCFISIILIADCWIIIFTRSQFTKFSVHSFRCLPTARWLCRWRDVTINIILFGVRSCSTHHRRQWAFSVCNKHWWL